MLGLEVATLVLLSTVVKGHGWVAEWATSQNAWEPAQRTTDPGNTAYRAASTNTGYIGSFFLNSSSMVCGAINTPRYATEAPDTPVSDVSLAAPKTVPVEAGGRVTIGVLAGPSLSFSHDTGHIQTYLGFCGTSPTACQSFDAATASWVKIQSALNALHALRRSFDLINWSRGDQWSVKIPTSIATGSYLFRTEFVTFNQSTYNESFQDQYYTFCGQVYITNPVASAVTPAGVLLPQAYRNININPSTVQGPDVIPGGESLNVAEGDNITIWWPSLSYNPPGSWNNDTSSDIAYSNTPGATATFTFNGSAVYLSTPFSSDRGAATILLDGVNVASISEWGPTDTLDDASVVWGVSNLKDGNHTVVIRNDMSNGSYVSVQSFAFKAASGDRAFPTSTSIDPVGGGSSSVPIGAIVGGVVGGLIFLFLLGLLAWWFRKQRREKQKDEGRWDAPPTQNVTAYGVEDPSSLPFDEQSRYSQSRYSTATATSYAPTRPMSQSSTVAGRFSDPRHSINQLIPESPTEMSYSHAMGSPRLATHDEEEHGIHDQHLPGTPTQGTADGELDEPWRATDMDKAPPPGYTQSA